MDSIQQFANYLKELKKDEISESIDLAYSSTDAGLRPVLSVLAKLKDSLLERTVHDNEKAFLIKDENRYSRFLNV
jgi:hypothetical protein